MNYLTSLSRIVRFKPWSQNIFWEDSSKLLDGSSLPFQITHLVFSPFHSKFHWAYRAKERFLNSTPLKFSALSLLLGSTTVLYVVLKTQIENQKEYLVRDRLEYQNKTIRKMYEKAEGEDLLVNMEEKFHNQGQKLGSKEQRRLAVRAVPDM